MCAIYCRAGAYSECGHLYLVRLIGHYRHDGRQFDSRAYADLHSSYHALQCSHAVYRRRTGDRNQCYHQQDLKQMFVYPTAILSCS